MDDGMSETNETFQNLLDNLLTIMVNSDVSEEFLTDVLKRLQSLGYDLKEDDAWVISFSIQKVENDINNSCNTASIPDGLYYTSIDMICGQFLFGKKQSGQLDGFNLETAIRQVQTGDTNVTFSIGEGSSSPEQKLDSLIHYLMSNGRGDFISYRKIKW